MSNAVRNIRVFLANLAWLLSCMPGWVSFVCATRNVKRVQASLLTRMLRRNRHTDLGRAHRFESILNEKDYAALPLTDYEDYADSIDAIKSGRASVLTRDHVDLLQPTSGSTSATKLIPYTKMLAGQFRAAIDPWIASLYLAFPSLLFGRHYWSISPSTPCPTGKSSVRVGFAGDDEYLGFMQRSFARVLFAVPPEIARVVDHDDFEYLTLLFLCRESNLRLISVWHPSFMTVLLKALPRLFPSILRDIESGAINPDIKLDRALRQKLGSYLSPNLNRAKELAQIDLTSPSFAHAIWPGMRVVSCWTDGNSEPWRSELAVLFPQAAIQGKGLAATEGIVSFPLGKSGQKVCAVRSHYFEFIDAANGEARRAWEVEAGREYGVVLTTGGGLYRYRLHDIVRVTGFDHQAPCLEFLGRDNLVCDLVGEKLNARHVESCIRGIERELGCRFAFAMLAPQKNGIRAGYVLLAQPPAGQDLADARIADLMETALRTNYHYDHARRLSQLEPVRVLRIDGDATEKYRRHLIGKAMKAGDIKFQLLSTDVAESTEFFA
ncbi:GH3 auxin-responsive promoter family protein [bacterium]|nr:GH3 auxin-responsive promoter family protein [bacterium]